MRNRIHTAKPASVRLTMLQHLIVNRRANPQTFQKIVPTFSRRTINSLFRYDFPYPGCKTKIDKAIRKLQRTDLQGLEYFMALDKAMLENNIP